MSHMSHMNAGCHARIAAPPGGEEGWEGGGGRGEVCKPHLFIPEVQKMRPKRHEYTKRNVCIPKETTKSRLLRMDFLGLRYETCVERDVYAKRDVYMPKETYM